MPARLLHHLLRHFQPLAPAGAGEGTDSQLVERFVRQRDEAAFASLVRRHGPLVLGVGRRVLRHDQDAEDVFQATFLLLARHAASRRWQASIAGWLYCVAYRLAMRLGKQSVRRREVERTAGSRSATAASEDHSALCRVLDEELQRLADEYREPIVLCYLEGKTRDEAARQLGWSLRTLQRRLNQGLHLLRGGLDRRGVELPLALLLAGLSQQVASAGVSAAVVATTVEAAVGGVLSPRVAALVAEGARAMTTTTMTKIALGVLALLLLSAAAAVVGAVRDRPPAAKPAAEPIKPVASTWPEGAIVTGRIVDHRGAAVANAEVLLLGAERIQVAADRTWFVSRRGKEQPPSVRTDARGEFSVARKKGPADRIVVIAPALLFWSVPRKSLAAEGPVEVKLPPPGRIAIRCTLPGKAAKQPVSIELQGAERESDSFFFHPEFHSVANPGETAFKHLPPGQYLVQRVLNIQTGKSTVLMVDADRQQVKVEAGKQTTVRFERKTGRPLSGRVRGLEKVKLRYGHVEITYFGPPERLPGGKSRRIVTMFDVLPIQSDGRFTTNPIPPGMYVLNIFAVRASSGDQSNQESDFDATLSFTVPQRGEMPSVEVVARPSTRSPRPITGPRVRVVDEAGNPLPAFEALIHTADAGYRDWEDWRHGRVGFGEDWLAGPGVDVLLRADGHAPTIRRFEGKDREKLLRGDVTITMKRGQKVQLHFRLPGGLTWPGGTMPQAYFAELQDRVQTMWQPVNRRDGEPERDFNMLNLRPTGKGRFECRLARDTPPFHVAIHAPGFLRCFEAGPFTLASFKGGVLPIDVPRPARLDIRFDPGAARADALPFKGVGLGILRQIHGNTCLQVVTDVTASHRHTWRLTDLAPGPYCVGVRTRPRPGSKPIPGTDINPGAYSDQKSLVLAAGASGRVTFGWAAFDPRAFRGKNTAVLRIRMPDGTPARGRRVSVGWIDGHYGSLPVYSGRLGASGELRLKDLTDRVLSSEVRRPYTVAVGDTCVGQFGFTTGQPAGEFEFHLAPRAGDLAPDVELTRTSTGKPVRLGSLRGQVVCLEFWATWCGPCQPALARLNEMAARQGAAWKGQVALAPVSIDDAPARVRPHALRRGWNHLDLHWTGQKKGVGFDAPAARAFVVNGVPEAVLIGRDGRILWRGHPLESDGGRSLESRINEALKK